MTAGTYMENKALEERLAALCEMPGMDLAVENHASRQRREVASFMEAAYGPIPVARQEQASAASIADRLMSTVRHGLENRIVVDSLNTLVTIVRHKSCIAKAYHYAVGHAH